MKKALQLINTTLKREHKIAVAVSGGRDSMALLHLALEAKKTLNFELVVVNIDHNLREKNSQNDSKFVCDFCAEKGIPFLHFFVDVPSIMRCEGIGGELAARKARHEVFIELKNTASIRYLLVAHHQRDQAETVLLNLLFGSGFLGASGMQILRDDYIFRPLLTTPYEEICDYVKEHKIPFVEDETNKQNDYARNFLRNKIFPLLEERWNATQSLSAFATRCREDEELLLSLAGKPIECGEGILLAADKLAQAKPLALRYISKGIKMLGEHKDFFSVHLEGILQLADLQIGKRLDLPQEITALKTSEGILLTRNKIKPPSKVQLAFEGEGEYILGDWQITIKKATPQLVDKPALIIDADRLPPKLTLRFRQEGDRFTRFGGGSVSLKKFLSERQVSLLDRNQTPLLAHQDQVLVVCGEELTQSLKITPHTKNAFIITAKKGHN